MNTLPDKVFLPDRIWDTLAFEVSFNEETSSAIRSYATGSGVFVSDAWLHGYFVGNGQVLSLGEAALMLRGLGMNVRLYAGSLQEFARLKRPGLAYTKGGNLAHVRRLDSVAASVQAGMTGRSTLTRYSVFEGRWQNAWIAEDQHRAWPAS